MQSELDSRSYAGADRCISAHVSSSALLIQRDDGAVMFQYAPETKSSVTAATRYLFADSDEKTKEL